MYNNWQIGAENGGKEYLASNQVVGGSSPSGRAKFIKHLRHHANRGAPRKPDCPNQIRISRW